MYVDGMLDQTQLLPLHCPPHSSRCHSILLSIPRIHLSPAVLALSAASDLYVYTCRLNPNNNSYRHDIMSTPAFQVCILTAISEHPQC